MRLTTEHSGTEINRPVPFAEQREVQSMQGGGQNWTDCVGQYKQDYRLPVYGFAFTLLIPLES